MAVGNDKLITYQRICKDCLKHHKTKARLSGAMCLKCKQKSNPRRWKKCKENV